MVNPGKRVLTYVPLEQATALPNSGFWEVWTDCYWAHQPGRGLLFFAGNPQCNRIESIARQLQQRQYPQVEVIHVPRAYVKHNCNDYL